MHATQKELSHTRVQRLYNNNPLSEGHCTHLQELHGWIIQSTTPMVVQSMCHEHIRSEEAQLRRVLRWTSHTKCGCVLHKHMRYLHLIKYVVFDPTTSRLLLAWNLQQWLHSRTCQRQHHSSSHGHQSCQSCVSTIVLNKAQHTRRAQHQYTSSYTYSVWMSPPHTP